MTGSNLQFTTAALGSFTCKTLTLNFGITTNDGTTATGAGNNVSPTQAGCYNGTESRPFTITEVNLTMLTAKESNGPSGSTKKGTLSLTMTWDLPAGVVCKFSASELPFTYVSTASPAVLTFNKAGGITSTGGCGSATLDASFILEKKGTTTAAVLH